MCRSRPGTAPAWSGCGRRKTSAASASRSTTPGASGSRSIRIAQESRAYVIVGLLAEKRFGRWRAFVNAENLGDVRQTRWDPLVRPSPGADGRWTVDAWAPLDGRVINGGVRVAF